MRNYDSKKNFMGLAIVKHIAQLHQGHVSLESTPGQGSTFSIHLNA